MAAVDCHNTTAVGCQLGHGRGFCGRRKAGMVARAIYIVEEAEHGRRSVEDAVAAEECGVGEDAAPELTDEGCAEEVRGLFRRDAEEDLGDGVVDELRRRARRRHGLLGRGGPGFGYFFFF